MLPGAGMDPRRMSMMMKQLGINVEDLQDVQEVVVRTATKDYVFTDASVSIMKAKDVETWQISGNPKVVEHEVRLVATPEDIAMVVDQTGCTEADAKAALEACNGDLAEAILKLSE